MNVCGLHASNAPNADAQGEHPGQRRAGVAPWKTHTDGASSRQARACVRGRSPIKVT